MVTNNHTLFCIDKQVSCRYNRAIFLGVAMNKSTESEYESHYKYLDDHLDCFWVKVFGKTLGESWFGGIISAHGDKGYGYRRAWEEAGIPFNHGMMLFMLTYTDKITTEKSKSKEWIIANYNHYLPLIEEAEHEVAAMKKMGYDKSRLVLS